METNLMEQLVDHLVLNSSFIPYTGLYNGKMGTVIFFTHFARYTNNPLYDDFASMLLDEVYEDVYTQLPVNFAEGICGIGWAIEYLVQQQFMEGDTDEVLKGIDQQVMLSDPRRITDMNFTTGLDGLICYVLSRLLSPRKNSSYKPFDLLYLSDISNRVHNIPPQSRSRWIESFINYMQGEKIIYSFQSIINEIITPAAINETQDASEWPVGLEKGCCGMGLKLIGI